MSLHKILLNKPTTKMGVVTGVIEEHAITIIVQVYCVACCQSQGGAQGNDIPTSRSTLISISTTKSGVVYLKINVQKSGRVIFKSREIKMVNPRYWNSEDPRY